MTRISSAAKGCAPVILLTACCSIGSCKYSFSSANAFSENACIAVNDGVDSQRGDGEGFAAVRNLFKNTSCLGRVFC